MHPVSRQGRDIGVFYPHLGFTGNRSEAGGRPRLFATADPREIPRG